MKSKAIEGHLFITDQSKLKLAKRYLTCSGVEKNTECTKSCKLTVWNTVAAIRIQTGSKKEPSLLTQFNYKSILVQDTIVKQYIIL